MKLAKLSLAAMVVAGLASSSFAADTLADAFKNGKVSGELKAWYFQKDVEKDASKSYAGGNVDIFTTAATLSYITDSFYGFSFGATFQGAANPDASDSAKTQYVGENYAGGATLSEAYLQYSIGKTTVKAGRQFIATPLVNGSGSRIFKEAFEGVTVVNTDLPQTTLVAGWVDKFQGRTSAVDTTSVATLVNGSDQGNAPKFRNSAAFTGGASAGLVATFEDAYTVAVINNSIKDLTLTAQYALVTEVANLDDVSVYYTEVNYLLPVLNFKLGFDVNYRGSQAGSQLDSKALDGHYLAGRVSIKELAGFGVSFAAGTTSNSDNVIAGMGNGPTSYTSTLINGTSSRMTANTDSYLFAATYDFSKVGIAGLTAVAQYGWTNQEAWNIAASAQAYTDITNFAAGVTYAVPALKGLTTSLEYENARKEGYDKTSHAKTSDSTADAMWFKAGYKF